jgi:hypothetical protein
MSYLRFPLVPVDPRSVPGPRPSRYDTFGPIRVCRVDGVKAVAVRRANSVRQPGASLHAPVLALKTGSPSNELGSTGAL